jgi:transcription elongation GreA/GreB family factor
VPVPERPKLPNKETLKEELARLLAADLATRERAHRAAREGATHEEAKPENDKDTRALEQSYLARGEALRVEELKVSLAEVQNMPIRAARAGDPAALGALVKAEENGEAIVLWLAPYGGGNRLAGGAVQIVTPKSPLGRALIGKRAGDECEVRLAGKSRVLTIESVE